MKTPEEIRIKDFDIPAHCLGEACFTLGKIVSAENFMCRKIAERQELVGDGTADPADTVSVQMEADISSRLNVTQWIARCTADALDVQEYCGVPGPKPRQDSGT